MSNHPLFHPQILRQPVDMNPPSSNQIQSSIPFSYPHVQQPPNQQQPLQPPQHASRKRPKYSRSKQGCLSCRVRKVKCDETRPICTRCAHSQRECTWPAETGKSRKSGHGHSQSQSTDSDPNPGSRPSTSGGTDNEWHSDAANAGAGPFRTTNRMVDAHSRNSSVGSGFRGRELGVGSANGSRNPSQSSRRGISPNPFAFGVHHLDPPPPAIATHNNQHHRSTSTSSNSSLSSLPYPLVSAHHPTLGVYPPTTGLPGLSTSQDSSPSSAPFGHSPTNAWANNIHGQPIYGERPGTAGSNGLADGLGNLTFGFDGNLNFLDSGTAYPPFNFGGGGGYDHFVDNSGSLLAQLGGQDGSGLAYPDLSTGSASSNSPDMMMDLNALDPRSLSSPLPHNFGDGGLNINAPTTSMPGFRQAQTTSTAAPGFGLLNSPLTATQPTRSPNTTTTTTTNTSPFQFLLDPPHPASHYGTNPSTSPTSYNGPARSGPRSYDPQAHPRHPPPDSATYGMEDPLSYTGSTIPGSEFSSPAPTVHSPINLQRTTSGWGVGERTSTPPPLLHSDLSVAPAPGGGVGAGLYTGEVRVGPQGRGTPTSSSTMSKEMMEGLMGESPELRMEGSAWEEGGPEPSPSSETTTPPALPRFHPQTAMSPHQARHPSSGSQTIHRSQPQPQIVIPDNNKQGQSTTPRPVPLHHPLRSHSSGFKLRTHARGRSDTITPGNALAMVYPEDGEHEIHPENQRIGFGSGQWGSLSNRHMMSNPDPLEPFFRTVRERNLIRHYCQTLTQIMMALPSSLNPILSIHLPIILSMPSTGPGSPPLGANRLVSPPTSPEFLNDAYYQGDGNQTQGSLFGDTNSTAASDSSFPVALGSLYEYGYGQAPSPTLHAAVEALRLSVLGVAAIHQCYLLARSGLENRFKAMEMWNYATGMRVLAAQHLEYAISEVDGRMSDAALGACCTIALIDIFAGGHNYQANMGMGLELIASRGGPGAMVRGSTASMQETISPTFEGPTHFIEAIAHSSPDPNTGVYSPRRGVLISSARLLLEQLTVYDTFSTLTSGEQPALLRPDDWHWWHEGDNSNYHAFSVENMFGMSRSIVSLFSRVSAFLNRYSEHSRNGTLYSVDGHPTPDPTRPPTPAPSLSGLSPDPPPPNSRYSALYTEARSLLREVETWTDPPSSPHPRVKWGNGAHQWAMMILLLREAFNLRHDDPRVQQCAKLTLWATVKASDHFRMSVDLTWPVIIAGSQCGGQQRAASYYVLEGFRKQCCFEIDTSEQILKEVWVRMDAGLPRADFRSVIEDLGLRVLIL